MTDHASMSDDAFRIRSVSNKQWSVYDVQGRSVRPAKGPRSIRMIDDMIECNAALITSSLTPGRWITLNSAPRLSNISDNTWRMAHHTAQCGQHIEDCNSGICLTGHIVFHLHIFYPYLILFIRHLSEKCSLNDHVCWITTYIQSTHINFLSWTVCLEY